MRRLLEETEPIWRELARTLLVAAAQQAGWYLGDELGRRCRRLLGGTEDVEEEVDE